MTALLYVLAVLVAAQARAEVIDLKCTDNATCIEHLTKELVRGIRQQKTIHLFDVLTIEPTGSYRQARSNQGALAKFLSTHALSFDWDDYSFRFTKPASRSGVIEMDIFDGRAVEEVEATNVTKKAPGSEEKDEGKPKRRIIRRRNSKRIMQAILPMMLGVKMAAAVILAISAVAAITMKAFLASKVALLVTVSMAAKKLYESFGQGVGLQNHPYLYSQYPVDFPSASSHAYSVSGASNPQFPAPELFGPTALASHTHQHEMLQQSDSAAQQSQSAASLQLANATRASERWDGKSKLLNLVKPIVDKVKSVLQPLAGKIVDVMPASFRAMTSKAFGLEDPSQDELEDFIESRVPKGLDIEASYKPKQILVPKPRLISRKAMARAGHTKIGQKKVIISPIDLNNLKENKDLNDYVKTKKYNFNYQNTHFYPRMKYFTVQTTNHPQGIFIKDTVSKSSYRVDPKEIPFHEVIVEGSAPLTDSSESFTNFYFKRLSRNQTTQKVLRRQRRGVSFDSNLSHLRQEKQPINFDDRSYLEKEIIATNFETEDKKFTEVRSISESTEDEIARGLSEYLFNTDPVGDLLKEVNQYVKSHKKPLKAPIVTTSQKMYYVGLEMVMFSLQMFDVYSNMADSIIKHLSGGKKPVKKIKKSKEHKKRVKKIKRKVSDTPYNKQINKKVKKA